jgi:sulfur-oxidizing protein SoxY
MRKLDQSQIDRRHCVALGMGLSVLGLSIPLQAQTPSEESALAKALRNRRLPSDSITLEFPRLADTGNAVPLRVEIAAPAGLTLAALEVILPENPNPSVVKLRLAEPQARYLFHTRLRLAASQDAWVIATYSDGSQRAASAPTIITSSACFDGTG